MSVEGGMSGTQRRIVCVNCGKVFFAWRPDTAPGAKIKCYFCKKEMEDEAARRAVEGRYLDNGKISEKQRNYFL